ncbi:sulfatase-like hydrolase/transferase [Flammeovirga kamogawensis]|uniref:Sulfatase-like hydrolase/transferase n=1 Tax=Flammeovirga kamogawensis TaxID=373891 RepID=A0ABX8H4S1_9BACT|nr:sulfatase-like hydrolase/transferase [Flammeovirga kamogawensis]MBB6463518.1 putative sulfatase [Flammeovirga kamogawensis]QWG10577.1 sulfatase-like hydrolase/transferase [Flammeovirga kamogawensis]TRX63683.1 sulfatase-like hydrolase/transferase [Flammeovirga kamogawensis]
MKAKLFWTLLLTLCFCKVHASDDAPKKATVKKHKTPNLLIILTDEHNFRTLGIYKDLLLEKGLTEMANPWGVIPNYNTPFIDRIGKEGAVLTSMYASTPSCAPSRSSMFTGNYPQTTGVYRNGIGIKEDAQTIAKVLNKVGYTTGYSGKWHLENGDPKPGWNPPVSYHGFTDNRYMFNSGHWKKLTFETDGITPKVAEEKAKKAIATADKETYTTDWLANRTIEFIEENKTKPFMYVVSMPDPHTPNLVRAPYNDMYNKKNFHLPTTYSTTALRGTEYPKWVSQKQRFKEGYDSTKLIVDISRYHGAVKCIDDNVGRIIKKLEDEDLLDNTIIVFTSDHGDMLGELAHENKGTPYESSAKIPFVIRYPKMIKAGTVVNNAVNTTDWMDTFLAMIDVDNKYFNSMSTQGRDFSKLLKGENESTFEDITFVRFQFWVAAVTNRYKLVYDKSLTKPWFFDLEKDPTETTNLFDHPEYKGIISELSTKLLAYGDKTNDDIIHYEKLREMIVANSREQ